MSLYQTSVCNPCGYTGS